MYHMHAGFRSEDRFNSTAGDEVCLVRVGTRIIPLTNTSTMTRRLLLSSTFLLSHALLLRCEGTSVQFGARQGKPLMAEKCSLR